MLIEVRGAGGSGKSTVVRRVMARYAEAEPLYMDRPIVFDTLKRGRMVYTGRQGLVPFEEYQGDPVTGSAANCRKRPLGYILQHPAEGVELAVLGHYATECGGADTIPSTDLLYHLVRQQIAAGRAVLIEGRLMSWSDNRRPLDVPGEYLAVCIEQTVEDAVAATVNRRNNRGAVTGAAKLANITKNARGEVRGVASSARRLQEAGREVAWCDRDEALRVVAERLWVSGANERSLVELGIELQAKEDTQTSLW